MFKKLILSLALCMPVALSLVSQAIAEEISITGNGEGTTNEAHVETQQTTNVEQNNQASVSNNVGNNANTGENETNANSGDALIDTGNVTLNTSVSQENLNSNFASNPNCACESETNVTISGNGAGSTNTVNVSSTNSVTSSQTNQANITNNVNVSGNSGRNTSNYNAGDVSIKTGNIYSEITLVNKNINKAVSLLGLGSSDLKINVSGNGEGSDNKVVLNLNSYLANYIDNIFNSNNNINANLNTGDNKANGNNGDVAIVTGDILSMISITNEANSSFTHADCDCERENPNNPTPTPPPPPTSSGGPCTSNCSTSSVQGASTSSGPGQTLPATGSYMLYLLTLASLIMFFMGWYLRFRSGIAPGKN